MSGGLAGFRRRSSRREELELELSRTLRGRATAFVARYLVKLSEGVWGGLLDSIVISIWWEKEDNVQN